MIDIYSDSFRRRGRKYAQKYYKISIRQLVYEINPKDFDNNDELVDCDITKLLLHDYQ